MAMFSLLTFSLKLHLALSPALSDVLLLLLSFRPNETFCSSLTGDGSRISILELYNQCQSGQSEPSDEAQDSVTSTTEVRKSDFIPGTTEDSLNSALSLHTIGQKDLLLSPTDFLTTVFENDPTTSFSITQSSIVSPKTSSSSDVLPKELTDLPITKQTFPENGSSSWNQSEIPRDYPEDYDEQETQPIVTTVGSRITACDYDHCRHLQTPCSELQCLKPCMCPGLSGDHLIPDPPHLQGVFEITDTSAQILWCSPNSIVEKYQLVYDHESDANQTVDNIYVTMRQFTLYNLVPHTTYKVCVMAFNKKGHSAPINNGSRTPCAEFKTRPSYILILSILSALGGLFLAAIAVLSICLYKACKNSVSKYDTHLVSYKNPAFEYHCTIPSYH
ncbi:leucine-rich repeat neuronal protein 4-like [Eleutherodactylus coqui]|uniref:leucine-rich repeat neuronal protein 4-like n=1 Tax=Eleutherodactylus coqui TaxID=57060 RepID=UPI0034619D49